MVLQLDLSSRYKLIKLDLHAQYGQPGMAIRTRLLIALHSVHGRGCKVSSAYRIVAPHKLVKGTFVQPCSCMRSVLNIRVNAPACMVDLHCCTRSCTSEFVYNDCTVRWT